jgi:hypothetical protein
MERIRDFIGIGWAAAAEIAGAPRNARFKAQIKK